MRVSSILNALLLVSGSYAWKWAKKGKASVTRYGSMGILSCNCKISAMEVGPACAINENAYGGYDGLGSGVGCGMCYKLTPYGTSETDQWPKSEADLPGPMVFKVTDICPYNANPKWCPSQESEPKNSVGMEYHFDINVDSWQPETLLKWFANGSLGTMNVEFELVSCEEWIGWSKKGQFEGLGDNPWWGCCPANPAVDGDICGFPAENKAPAPQETDRIKPTDFPFLTGGSTGDEPEPAATTAPEVQATTQVAAPTTSTSSCWAEPDYKCCTKTCDVVYADDNNWGVEDGEWCGIDNSVCTKTGVEDCGVINLGYPCCKSTCDVVFEDEYQWGVENNEWCGISPSRC